jgi:hypothetical protein
MSARLRQPEKTDAYREKRIRAVPYDPAPLVFDGWDVGKGPKMSVGLFQRFRRTVHMIGYLEGQESDGIPQVVRQLKEKRTSGANTSYRTPSWRRNRSRFDGVVTTNGSRSRIKKTR